MADQKIWSRGLFTIQLDDGETIDIVVSGRDRWALEALIAAGPKGCTPIEIPGPRWSGYIHKLRKLCVPIETVKEAHNGPFAGTHARYILRARVTRSGGNMA